MLKTRPDLNIKELRRLQRQYWTAFKHAVHQHSRKERDDDKLLSWFTDEQNDTALLIGWYDYAEVTKRMPVEAQVQQAWYIALHPEKLDPKHPKEPYEKLFPDLQLKTRAEQKRRLNDVIERARRDKDVMKHPGTERRALILDWPPPPTTCSARSQSSTRR
jgi:hypothetical protein